jgi:hypothetical protein
MLKLLMCANTLVPVIMGQWCESRFAAACCSLALSAYLKCKHLVCGALKLCICVLLPSIIRMTRPHYKKARLQKRRPILYICRGLLLAEFALPPSY